VAGGANNLEFGTSGDTVTTTASSGGGDAFSTVTIASGHTCTIDTAHVRSGTRAMKITSNSTARTGITYTLPAQAKTILSATVYLEGRPSSDLPLLVIGGVKLLARAAGTFYAQNNAGTGVSGSTSAVLLPTGGAWVRVVLWSKWAATTTTGTIGFSVWVDSNVDGATPDFTFETTTDNAGTTAPTIGYVGKNTSASAITANLWFDDISWSDSAYAGSVSLSGSGTLTASGTPGTPSGGPVDLSGTGTLTATGTPAVAGACALTGSGSLTTTGHGPLGKIAMIGDSQFYALGTGATGYPASLVSSGWLSSDVWFYGVSSKTIGSADSNGYTTMQNIAQARAALGAEPALWVINLGGNNVGAGQSSFGTLVQWVLDALGPTHGRLVWVGIQSKTGTGAPATYDSRQAASGWIRDYLATADPTAVFLDVTAWLATDPAGVTWNADGIHLANSASYQVREAWLTSQIYPLVATALTGSASFGGSGILTATGAPSSAATATLAGAGTLTATGAATVTAVATLTGSGTLTTSGVPKPTGVATLAGSGTLTVAGVPSMGVAVALSGAGSLTAAAAHPLRDVTMRLGPPTRTRLATGAPTRRTLNLGTPRR